MLENRGALETETATSSTSQAPRHFGARCVVRSLPALLFLHRGKYTVRTFQHGHWVFVISFVISQRQGRVDTALFIRTVRPTVCKGYRRLSFRGGFVR